MSKKRFYLIKRADRLTNGKATYYARFRNEAGELLPWRSTGETAKTRAELWALDQIKLGFKMTDKRMRFSEYAENWWKWDKCSYVRRKLARGKSLSKGYADARRTYLERHILPAFKDMFLQEITAGMIENWLMALKDAPRNPRVPESLPLSPTTVNHCLGTLRTMMSEAFRLGYITNDPAGTVEKLQEFPKEKQILTLTELRTLLDESKIGEVWKSDRKQFSLNLLAASTGMRMGEIQALQVQNLRPDHIVVAHSWGRKYGLKEPKWNSFREIPIPAKTSRFLFQLVEESPYNKPEDFVFFGKNGRTPIGDKSISKALYSGLARIGIGSHDRELRNITFHSWRHLFNSICRSRIPDYKLRLLTGHRAEEMTEHYTHVTLQDFADVQELQERFIGK